MAFNMLAQFGSRRCHISRSQKIDERFVVIDPHFQLCLLHALAEAMEENSQQIAKGHQWGTLGPFTLTGETWIVNLIQPLSSRRLIDAQVKPVGNLRSR